MLDIDTQLARLKQRVAAIDAKYARKDITPSRPTPAAAAATARIGGARTFIEEWAEGSVIGNEFGEHFQSERLFSNLKQHGSADVGALSEQPASLLDALSDNGIPDVAPQRWAFLDTETTGLDPLTGDRIIEIAAIELIRDLPTGKVFHRLVDPERDIPEEATRIHGFSRSDLMGRPKFAEIVDELLAFLADSPLVAHNAPFDFAFVNAELSRLSLPGLAPSRMIDTLALAKARFPGMPNSLNALCGRFAIDLSERTTHNALLDCRLLAEVYVELTGGRQRGLVLQATSQAEQSFAYTRPATRTPVFVLVSAPQLAAHSAFVARLKDPVWLIS